MGIVKNISSILLINTKLTQILCDCEDYCIPFEQLQKSKSIVKASSYHKPTWMTGLQLIECRCIISLNHFSGIKFFKYNYQYMVINAYGEVI